jgi:hypothetical protein
MVRTMETAAMMSIETPNRSFMGHLRAGWV